ncbi:FxsA family protein [Mycobacterium sp. CVI_P3]|uniref:FxsA family protein n=2 Tax=Mycobacterium pinniadriaticum TaxID=2994102 RepID=A0ABT3SAP7_9MYCO|nr:FxsA family protein [Mycobacterium pinniadriaticum]MCX2930345.1 FxsA family protein [Mycobacterium pinniadriaticum]MCX2936593.1 FxsA family protein [Mycobacterium pinniadriaticum]
MVMRTFFGYVVVELAVLAALTWSVGLGWTLLILLGTSVVGVALAGSQVKRQILRLQSTRTDPQGAVADGMLVALGTVLVFIPGLVTTALGALMLLPPTRTLVRPLAGMLLIRGIARRVTVVNLTAPGYPGRGDYIDGEVVDEQVYGRVHDANIVRRY